MMNQMNLKENQKNRPTGRKKRTPRAVVIQEPPSVPVKKTQESSGKLKGIKLLSDAAQLEIDTQRAIKASKHESRLQHQSGGSSERAGLRPKVPNELTGKSTVLDEGAEYLLAYNDEKPKDIPWQSTDEDESDNDDDNKEDEADDDESIDIEKTDDERTNTDDEDTVMGKAEKIVEQKADEEYKADEEQKGDEHTGDEQVVAVKHVVQRFTELEQSFKELKQANHSTAILALIRSQLQSVVKEYLGSSLPDAFHKVTNLILFSRKETEEMIKIKTLQLDQTRLRRPRREDSMNLNHPRRHPPPKNNLKVGDASQPPHVDADETQPDAASKIPKKDWFKKAPRPEILDPDWNTVKTVDDTLEQPWLNEMIQAEKPPLTYVELEYNIEECYRALTDQLDRANPEVHISLVDMSKPLPLKQRKIVLLFQYKDSSCKVEKRSRYGYLKEIVMRQADQKLYKFKEGDLPDLHLNDIEDMRLLIAQNKLFNLEGDVIVGFVTALKMFTRGIIVKNRYISVKEPYTPNYDPPDIFYEDKIKNKWLMRLDEIHKFCDGTLQSMRTILQERLLNFDFGYNKDMPLREWIENDKRRTSIMLNKIDELLLKRRILRSLEVLVGGR
ncbi:hypothetical protein Tco_0569415 [Tanacetum coccineum]